jgi:hypothetical protein
MKMRSRSGDTYIRISTFAVLKIFLYSQKIRAGRTDRWTR